MGGGCREEEVVQRETSVEDVEVRKVGKDVDEVQEDFGGDVFTDFDAGGKVREEGWTLDVLLDEVYVG